MPRLSRSTLLLVAALASAFAAAGCGVQQKKSVAKAAVNSMSPEQRRESFEATARLLDEQPQTVDELYAVLRNHRSTMDRVLLNATTDLDEKWMAKITAHYLAQQPAAVNEVLMSTIDEVHKDPKARASMDVAISNRAEKTVDILTDDAETLGRVIHAVLVIVDKKPAARKNLLAALSKERKPMVDFILADKAFAHEVTEDLVREAVKDRPMLDKLLRATGAIADENAPPRAKEAPKK